MDPQISQINADWKRRKKKEARKIYFLVKFHNLLNLRTFFFVFSSVFLFAACHPRTRPAPRYVLWISLDDVKAASLGCYGRERPTSPSLDALARQGLRFQNCITQAGWTLPSYASMLTSRYPDETVFTREYLRHLRGETDVARSRDPYRLPEMNRHWYGKLRPELPTLAEVLARAGFRTAAWTNNQWLSPALSGLDRGFGEYHFTDQPDAFYHPADQTLAEVTAWIEQHRQERFFVFVHLMDVHKPWRPHPEFGFGQRPLDQYEAGLRFTDQAIGRLVERLRQLKLWDRTLLVVNSDHGEGIYEARERFVGHGGGVIPDLIRVPLLIVGPGLPRGKVIGPTVRNLDIFPTILDLLGVKAGPPVRGRSLKPLWADDPCSHAPDYLPAVTMGMIKGPEQISVITARHQIILIPAYGSSTGTIWGDDQEHPCAPVPLETQRESEAAANQVLQDVIAEMQKTQPLEPVPLDPATIKKLKALGYFQ